MSFLDNLKSEYRRLSTQQRDTPRNTRSYVRLKRQLDELRGQAKLADRLDRAMREQAI